MTAEAYSFHRSFEPAGPQEFRMDRHYLLYAMTGTLRLQADGQRWTLPPARAALIAAEKPVTISILTQTTSASVLFAPALMVTPCRAVTVFDVSPLARELIAECRAWGPEAADLPPYARRIFLALAAVVEKLAETPSPCVLPMPTSAELARALDLTEAQAAGEPQFAAIARQSGQSVRALARRFSEEIGMTWREALRRIRIIRAVEALAMTDAPITAIALDVGYNSISAFNAGFRDLMGMSPSEYRATLKV